MFSGDVSSGQYHFSAAYKLRDSGVPEDKVDNLLDVAILSMANNEFDPALKTLLTAEQIAGILASV